MKIGKYISIALAIGGIIGFIMMNFGNDNFILMFLTGVALGATAGRLLAKELFD